jgi:hypothetical protein
MCSWLETAPPEWRWRWRWTVTNRTLTPQSLIQTRPFEHGSKVFSQANH